MRSVGGELPLLGKGGVEPGERGIKSDSELSEFTVDVRDVDALRQMTGGNPAGSSADGFDGTDGVGGNPPAAAESEGKHSGPRAGENQSKTSERREFGGDGTAHQDTAAFAIEIISFAVNSFWPKTPAS